MLNTTPDSPLGKPQTPPPKSQLPVQSVNPTTTPPATSQQPPTTPTPLITPLASPITPNTAQQLPSAPPLSPSPGTTTPTTSPSLPQTINRKQPSSQTIPPVKDQPTPHPQTPAKTILSDSSTTAPKKAPAKRFNPIVLVGAALLIIAIFVIVKTFFLKSENQKSPSIVDPIPTTQTNKSPTITPIPTRIPQTINFTDKDLQNIIYGLAIMEDSEFKDNLSLQYEGCKTTGGYQGRIKGDRQYAQQHTQIAEAKYKSACDQQDITETFAETYWLAGEIYTRQNRDHEFTRQPSGSNAVTASAPMQYLYDLFPTPENLQVTNSEQRGSILEIEASNSYPDAQGYFVFNIDLNNYSIRYFTYMITWTEHQKKSGNLHLYSPSSAITPPSSPI